MEKKDLRIVYMGTPDFAVESLRRLVEGGYNVVAVITMPDKPAGRGHKIQFSPVKEYALSQGLPVLQPERLKDEAFVEQLRSLHADLQIVVAFRMLPEVVWNMPPMGTFNLHASLLPQYRGAAPLNWAIINGDTETGITTFFLKHEIDTGEIIQQRRIPILPEDNVGTIHDKLMVLGADMVVETVDAILAGTVKPIEQESIQTDEPLRPAPKIFKETCRIDWSKPCRADSQPGAGSVALPGRLVRVGIGRRQPVEREDIPNHPRTGRSPLRAGQHTHRRQEPHRRGLRRRLCAHRGAATCRQEAYGCRRPVAGIPPRRHVQMRIEISPGFNACAEGRTAGHAR